MSAVRTVRLLDEKRETRTVAGVVIEKGVPLPTRHPNHWLEVFKAMDIGDSFVNKTRIRPGDYRKALPGRKFVTAKVHGGAFRHWRVA